LVIAVRAPRNPWTTRRPELLPIYFTDPYVSGLDPEVLLFSLHDEPLSPEVADHHVYSVSALYVSAGIRKCHPVGLADLRRAALPQLADLFERRDYQLHTCLLIDQDRVNLLVIQRLRFIRVDYSPCKSNKRA
jgi:hypothetical protein